MAARNPAKSTDHMPLTGRQRRRMRVVLWLFLAVFSIVGVNLIRLQAKPDPRFFEDDENHWAVVPIPMPRGRIYDSEGRILARERRLPSIYANPRLIDDPHRAAQVLSTRLAVDEDALLERMLKRTTSGKKSLEIPVKRYTNKEEIAALGDLNQFGKGALFVRDDPVRFYPEEQLAAHVLGYVNRDGTKQEGIEFAYDSLLRAIPGRQESRVDARRMVLDSLTRNYVSPQGGADLYLTIDKSIQHVLESELAVVMENRQASRAMGIVMDPKTGAVVAMASLPSFDPNAYWEYSTELRTNRSVTEVFEPGSSFKIVTAAAAIELGLITPDTMIHCENGAWNALGLRRIRDVHRMGMTPFSEAFAESSNIAIIKVANQIIAAHGKEEYDRWVRRFGFGQRTSPDFVMESAGIYAGASRWSKMTQVALPMGQEIAVTMPQLARAFSVIANGGYLVEPYLVERAVDQQGRVTYQREVKAGTRVISERTAQIMRDLCYQVVAHGTGTRAAIREYRAGGKTGTAQIAMAGGKGYYKDRYTAVFAGFAPIADPRLTVVIVVHDPKKGSYFGGQVAGPVFAKVVRESLIRLECPEDPMPEEDSPPPTVPSDADVLVAHVENSQDPLPSSQGPGPAIATAANAELPGPAVDQIVDVGALPNLAGLTKRQVKERLAALRVPWDSQGIGWVVNQEPPAGTPLTEVTMCRLVFSNSRSETNHDATGPSPNPPL
ncbi:MAG: penicillin-binding protein 3 [Candidatus Hydrogenedentota bacterium]